MAKKTNRLANIPYAEDRLHIRYRVWVECDCCGYMVPTPYCYPTKKMSGTAQQDADWWSKEYRGAYVQLWQDGCCIASAGTQIDLPPGQSVGD